MASITQQDLELIRRRLLALYSVEELREAGILDSQPDKALRVALAREDLEFFLLYYLGHHFSKALSPVHISFIQEMQELLETEGRISSVVTMPRGFGKTTIATMGVPAWCACLELRRYIMVISDAFDQAKEQLATLKTEFEENDRLIEDFGSLVSEPWAAAEIVTDNGVRIAARGAGMKIRGRKFGRFRPDLMVFDDIENEKLVESPTQLKSRKQWFYGTAQRAGWDDTKTVVVGNLLHSNSLLQELTENPMFRVRRNKAILSWAKRMDLWEVWERIRSDLDDEERADTARTFYEEHREEMDEEAISAWPEAFPYYNLMEMRLTDGPRAFAIEMQNSPAAADATLFRVKDPDSFYQEKIVKRPDGTYDVLMVPENGRAPVPLSACAVFGYTDPSMGQSRTADPSAIIILAKAPNGTMFVLEADEEIRSPEKTIAAQNTYAAKYNIVRYGIENVQFQALYHTISEDESRKAGVHLPLIAVSQTANKLLRIQSLEPDIERSWILFRKSGQEALLRQINEYPSVSHDDLLDALEGARSIALQWRGLQSVQVLVGETIHCDLGSTGPPVRGRRQENSVSEYDKDVMDALEDRIIDLDEALAVVLEPDKREALQSKRAEVAAVLSREKAQARVFVPETFL